MMTLKTIIRVLLFTSITTLSYNSQADIPVKQSTSFNTIDQEENIIKRTYKLKKFTQSCCAKMIEYSLNEVNGFIKQESDIKHQQITVWFNTKLCSEEDIKNAINKTTYTIIES